MTPKQVIEGLRACPRSPLYQAAIETIETLQSRLSAVSNVLQAYGVTEDRMKGSVANGVEVLASRLRREVHDLTAAANDFASRLEACQKELDEREDYELCDTCGNLSTETTDEDGDGSPLGHVQCAQCSRFANLEHDLSVARQSLYEVVEQRNFYHKAAHDNERERDAALLRLDQALEVLTDLVAWWDAPPDRQTSIAPSVGTLAYRARPLVQGRDVENPARPTGQCGARRNVAPPRNVEYCILVHGHGGDHQWPPAVEKQIPFDCQQGRHDWEGLSRFDGRARKCRHCPATTASV